ncbi:hypothetical protein [Thiocystis violacea]|uniref:hypothetical protein n=1 Tax=Thiocystis violacea TaxID=13725 RepID=UPI0019058B98|nr:hypothetical protein [Thiocystis violacea]MBK1717237.1 hypothetical protein [Thiocystis violacea]
MKTRLMALSLAAALLAGGPIATVLARQGADDPINSASPGDDRGGERTRGADDDGGDDRGRDDDPGRLGFPVEIDVETPRRGDRVGLGGRGWLVDLEIEYQVPLARTGFTVNPDGVTPGFQLTGAATHANAAPLPGTFGVGADDRLPGLIVLLTTTSAASGGPCQNLANLFNLTGITDLDSDQAELWDTWIIGASNFGSDVDSTLFVAVASDLNGDGIYNDAPDVLTDSEGDGFCTQADLLDHGVVSNIEPVHFHINGAVDLTGLPVVP